MQRKGQAELALVLGIAIILIFVVLYVLMTAGPASLQPGSLTGEQKAVEAYVMDTMERSATQILSDMYAQGGYVDPQTPGVTFLEHGGARVAYWQICDDVNIPPMEQNLRDGLTKLLKNTLPDKTDIAGKQVQFSVEGLSLEVTVFPEKISLKLSMPTVIDGQRRTQPYETEMDTKFGRISEFSENFARFQEKYRVTELNLLKLLSMSNPDSECWLPTEGFRSGGMFKMKWSDMRDCMQKLIDYTLARTLMWQAPILSDDGTLPLYFLDNVYIYKIEAGGSWVKYEDLDVSFQYGGEDKKLERTNSQFLFMTHPDPVNIRASWIPLISSIVPYDVKYDVSYPVAVIVRDDLLGRDFKFMTFSSISESAIRRGQCDIEEVVQDSQEELCKKDATVPLKVHLTDTQGNPLTASLSLSASTGDNNAACDFNIENGALGVENQLFIPQRSDWMVEIYHPAEGSLYLDCKNSQELSDMYVQMPLKDTFIFHIYIVELEKTDFGLLIKNIRSLDPYNPQANEKIELTLTKTVQGDCFEEPPSTSLKNYYMKEAENPEDPPIGIAYPDIEKSMVVPPDLDVSPPDIRLEVTDSYDVEVTTLTDQTAGAVSERITLAKDSFAKAGGKNVIYVYAPKIINGYSESDKTTIEAVYALADIHPLSNRDVEYYLNR